MNSKEKKQTYGIFLVYTFGMLMIAIGGILGILSDWLYWYPLGILTSPWVLTLYRLLEKNKEEPEVA